MNIQRSLKYLNDTGLNAEEHLLLYSVFVRQNNPMDREFLEQMQLYYQKHAFYDPKGANIFLSWSMIVNKLINDGFLIGHKGYVKPGPQGNMILDITRLEVTDKFLDTIYDSDREKWWNIFLEVHGTEFFIDGKRINAMLPDKQHPMTLEEMKDLFWKHCGGGDKYEIGKFLQNTEDYIGEFGTSQKVSTYLKNYEVLMVGLERRMSGRPDFTKRY